MVDVDNSVVVDGAVVVDVGTWSSVVVAGVEVVEDEVVSDVEGTSVVVEGNTSLHVTVRFRPSSTAVGI